VHTSIFLAKLIGPILLAAGISLFTAQGGYRALAEEFLRSRALIYLSGLLTMTAGVAVILTHNVWAADWRVVITILGWVGAIGGALCIVLPQGTERIGRWMLQHPAAMLADGAVGLAAGALLCFFGYAAATNAQTGATP